jgi:hypothetical protein
MREVRLFLVSRSSRPCIAVLLLELAEDSDSTGDATDERRGHRRSSPAGETKVWKHRARRRSQGRLEARVRLDHDCRRQERGTVQSTSLEHASPVPRGHTPAPRLAGKSITPPSLPALPSGPSPGDHLHPLPPSTPSTPARRAETHPASLAAFGTRGLTVSIPFQRLGGIAHLYLPQPSTAIHRGPTIAARVPKFLTGERK